MVAIRRSAGRLQQRGGGELTQRDRTVERYLREMLRLYDRLREETLEPRRLRIGCNRVVLRAVTAALKGVVVRGHNSDGKSEVSEVVVEELDTREQVARLLDEDLTAAIGYTTPKLEQVTCFAEDDHRRFYGTISDSHLFYGRDLLPPEGFPRSGVMMRCALERDPRLNGLRTPRGRWQRR